MGSGSSKETSSRRAEAGLRRTDSLDDQYYQGRLFAEKNNSFDKDSYSGRLSPYDRDDIDSIRESVFKA